jgi:hypothetical protein
MRLVHRHTAEAALPEMAGSLAACVNDACITAMDRGQRTAQAIRVRRYENEVHVIRH